jgi:hypothetical protein
MITFMIAGLPGNSYLNHVYYHEYFAQKDVIL